MLKIILIILKALIRILLAELKQKSGLVIQKVFNIVTKLVAIIYKKLIKSLEEFTGITGWENETVLLLDLPAFVLLYYWIGSELINNGINIHWYQTVYFSTYFLAYWCVVFIIWLEGDKSTKYIWFYIHFYLIYTMWFILAVLTKHPTLFLIYETVTLNDLTFFVKIGLLYLKYKIGP